MRSCRKFIGLTAFLLVCGIGFAAKNDDDANAASDAGATPAASPAPAASPKAAGKGGKEKKKDRDQGKGKSRSEGPSDEAKPPAAPGEDAKPRMQLPMMIEGQPSRGLKIPYGPPGKPSMIFNIGEALKLDNDHVQMQNMQVELIDEGEGHNMSVDLPASVLDTSTDVLTSHVAAKIKRDDFEVRGDTLEFNTKTKKGKFVGHVHMSIYDLKESVGPAATPPPPPLAAPKVK